MKQAIAFVISFAASALVFGHLPACSTQSASAKSTEADTAYTTELTNCTKNSNTLAESKACEAQVDIRWHADGGAK